MYILYGSRVIECIHAFFEEKTKSFSFSKFDIKLERPESPIVILTRHACKYKVHKLRQRYILNIINQVIIKQNRKFHT